MKFLVRVKDDHLEHDILHYEEDEVIEEDQAKHSHVQAIIVGEYRIYSFHNVSVVG